MRAISRPAIRPLAVAALILAALLALLWALGALAPLAEALSAQQKAVQSALAGAVRALRAGQPGAWTGLLALCFAYGFVHAAGPGHGKALIGAYGVAQQVRLGPLVGLAVISSLAQSLVAVTLVAAGAFAFGWTRERMELLADNTMTPLSHGLIALLGLWLLLRGLRALPGAGGAVQADGHGSHHDHPAHDHRAPLHDHHHGHDHGPDAACGCGHAHGPTPAQVAQVASLRDAALLVGAVALRPCSGALFLLILTFAMGIGWAGVAGSFAMGLGTAAVTALVAVLAVLARDGALHSLPGAGLARLVPGVQIVLGAALAVLSLLALSASL